MFCPNCGKEIADNSTSCPSCGATFRQEPPQDSGNVPAKKRIDVADIGRLHSVSPDIIFI